MMHPCKEWLPENVVMDEEELECVWVCLFEGDEGVLKRSDLRSYVMDLNRVGRENHVFALLNQIPDKREAIYQVIPILVKDNCEYKVDEEAEWAAYFNSDGSFYEELFSDREKHFNNLVNWMKRYECARGCILYDVFI